jgi:hypothetical protein
MHCVVSDLGKLRSDSGRQILVDMPSATIATTVATGKRSPRMHGTPPMRSGSTVIRSNDMEPA